MLYNLYTKEAGTVSVTVDVTNVFNIEYSIDPITDKATLAYLCDNGEDIIQVFLDMCENLYENLWSNEEHQYGIEFYPISAGSLKENYLDVWAGSLRQTEKYLAREVIDWTFIHSRLMMLGKLTPEMVGIAKTGYFIQWVDANNEVVVYGNESIDINDRSHEYAFDTYMAAAHAVLK